MCYSFKYIKLESLTMNKLEQERKKNRVLYRELFYEADKTFKEQLNKLKENFSCLNCNSCCRIRYSNLSPLEIFQLSKEEEAISSEYIKIFIPYGAEEFFSYEKNNEITVELNNKSALAASKDYVNKILSKSEEPVYFYFCKYLDDNKACIDKEKSSLCRSFPNSVTAILPNNCGFSGWQRLCMDKIKNEIEPDLKIKAAEILAYRNNFSCSRTGTCCRLACSEYSYEELKQKAQNGDVFAGEFTGVFIPYTSIEEAGEIFPDYVNLVLETLDTGESIYFYHCPHITEDNFCTIYEKRPNICRDFPDNPLSILHPSCGFYDWKEEVMVASLTLHAMTYIYKFYLEKIGDSHHLS